MTTIESSAEPGQKREYPIAALAAVGGALVLGVVYPSASYPPFGILVMTVIGASLLLTILMRGAARPVELIAAIWAVFWVLMRYRAPIASAGRVEVATAVLESAVFLAICRAASSLGAASAVRRSALAVIAGCLVIASVHGIAQVYGPEWVPGSFRAQERAIMQTYAEGDPLRDALLHAVGVARRAVGTLGAPNIFASCCVCGAILCAAFAVTRRGGWRVWGALGAAICAFSLLLTESRGGVMSLLTGAVTMAALLFTWRLNRRQTAMLLSGAGVLVAALLLCVVTIIARGNFTGRWLGVTGMIVRFQYWQTGLAMFRSSPLLGLGPGAYEIRYPQFRIPGSDETRHAHSLLFQYAATGGIVAVGIFLAFISAVGAAAWRSICDAKERADFSDFATLCGLAAAATALLAHGLLEYTFDFRETALLFFFLCGLLAARDRGTAPPSAQNLLRIAYVIAVVGLVGACEITARAMARADAAREDAAAYLQANETRQLALDAYARAIESDPTDPTNWELLGQLKQSLQMPYARRDIEHAAQLNPYSAHLHEELALISAEEKNWTDAVVEQREAVALHTLDAGHRLNLARILLRSGDAAAGRTELDAALKLRIIGTTDAQLRDDVQNEFKASGK